MSFELSVYNDPDVILAQTQAAVSTDPLLVSALGGAVTSIGGALGPSVNVSGSASSGFTVSVSGAANTLTISMTVSSAANARTTLGLGGLAVLNAAAAVANTSTVASAAYVQAEAQAVIDKLNALLTSLRTAGTIAT